MSWARLTEFEATDLHPILILIVAILFVLFGILVLRINAFVALILAALLVAFCTPLDRLDRYANQQVKEAKWTTAEAEGFLTKQTFAGRVTKGFGATCGSIGLLIAMASIIGRCMLISGAADQVVKSLSALFGQARMGISFVVSGFLLGVPVFFDTVFYLMIPLGRAAARRKGGDYLFFVLTIVAGATMAHSLVPPTPGPLIVVQQFEVDMLKMMIGGSIVGLFASSAGYLFARKISNRIELEIPAEASSETAASSLEGKRVPGLIWSLLPIALPVVLIGLATAVSLAMKQFDLDEQTASGSLVVNYVAPLLKIVGDKNIAMTISAGFSVWLLVWFSRANRQQIASHLQEALTGAGMIILITAAGGAFGMAIRQCGIADEISKLASGVQPILLLPLAFGVTTLIRTAQGSATVAMVTAAGVLQGFAASDQLTFDVVYLALAVGCGSKPIAWMADSGFWVICKMSGMSELQGLQTITPMSIIMGVTGLLMTMLGAICFPMV